MARKSTGTSNPSSAPSASRVEQAAASSNYQGIARTTAIAPQSTKSPGKAPGTPKPARAGSLPVLSHEQIAKRAQAIWEKKGRPCGQDEQNWLQAETELRTELRA